jgi:hypothetical protein
MKQSFIKMMVELGVDEEDTMLGNFGINVEIF